MTGTGTIGRGLIGSAALSLIALVALVAGAAAEAAQPPGPPLPGGFYKGETDRKRERKVKIKVRAASSDVALRGKLRMRCARIKAPFETVDGTFVAKQRNRRGKVIFKARGSFAGMQEATGSIERLKRSRRKPGCRPADFETELRNAGPIKERTVSYGPFHTDPTGGHGGHGGGGHNVVKGDLEKPCENCQIVGMVPDLREADGSRANFDTESMLHHVVFRDWAKKDATCKGRAERFFASGNERTPTLLPRGYGYEVTADADWHLITHIMNMSDHAKPLFIEVTFYYVDGTPLESVKPFWWDIDNCSDSEYMTPAGTHTETRDFTVPASLAGDVVAVGGHLHDYGERIKLENLTRGRTICEGEAVYGNQRSYMGHIEGAGGCIGRPVARLSAGEQVRLHSRYDAPEPLHDVMGIMFGYVAPPR